MIKKNDSQKITTLGVVIFSFISLLMMIVIAVLIVSLFALLILKTDLPENALMIGSVLGGGIGLVISTGFLTAVGKVKGILAAVIMFVLVLFLKVIGNWGMNMGGYFTLNGLIGILFMAVFSFVGGVVGAMLKKR